MFTTLQFKEILHVSQLKNKNSLRSDS